MRLFYSKTSPYARKVLICAQVLELNGDITLETVHPLNDSARLSCTNPLGKVPALVTREGRLIVDSPVICQYLDQLAVDRGQASLQGVQSPAREAVAVLQALADGIMDAAYLYVMESNRPNEQQSQFWKARWLAAIDQTLDYLESYPTEELSPQPINLGAIALGCALGYLDFRFPTLKWREHREHLSQWADTLLQHPAFRETAPSE
ncbi:MAG: glutathione S-transferase [Halomonadaceae bacterium]|nr:MAG: glutathione S-transferase [Halomonadaceae bacterium]